MERCFQGARNAAIEWLASPLLKASNSRALVGPPKLIKRQGSICGGHYREEAYMQELRQEQDEETE